MKTHSGCQLTDRTVAEGWGGGAAELAALWVVCDWSGMADRVRGSTPICGKIYVSIYYVYNQPPRSTHPIPILLFYCSLVCVYTLTGKLLLPD